MQHHRFAKTGIAAALFASAGAILAPTLASASARPHSFTSNQANLEAQLASRAAQLTRLSSDIAGSTTLTSAHLATLTADITAASTNISALIAKVPTDTTNAQITVDRRSMVALNRVFAVLTPQVFQVIEADAISASVSSLKNEESGLLSAVNGLVGENGYTNAFNHYTAFLKLVNQASLNSTTVAATDLAQVPADYPGDTNVFVRANHQLLNADIAIAHANYDASIIGLASGGYTGA
jgi:hypothetical protein